MLYIIIGVVWVVLVADAYLVTHRKYTGSHVKVTPDEEDALLYDLMTTPTADQDHFKLPEQRKAG